MTDNEQMTEHEKRVARFFATDIEGATIQVLFEHGGYSENSSYSHIRVNSQIGSYDIIIWPDHLAMSGDMGSWIFNREGILDKVRSPSAMALLCCAEDLTGVLEFDAPGVRKKISAAADELYGEIEAQDWPEWSKRFNTSSIQKDLENIYSQVENGEDLLRHALSRSAYFRELELMYMSRYTHSFLWACHAIAWVFKEKAAKGL